MKTKGQAKRAIDRVIAKLISQVTFQHLMGRRKDGRPNRTEAEVTELLNRLRDQLSERLEYCLSGEEPRGNALRGPIDCTKQALSRRQLQYESKRLLNSLCNAVDSDNLKDVLISQQDGSRFGYLSGIGELSELTHQGFSAFSTKEKTIMQLPLEGCSSQDRIQSHKFVASEASTLGDLVENNFHMGETELCLYVDAISRQVYPTTNQVHVVAIVQALGIDTLTQKIMREYKSLFIPPSGMGHLPPFFIDRQTMAPVEAEGKLYSRCLFGSEVGTHSVDARINMEQFRETLVDLAFLVAALDQGKPVYGSCQGAHVGWLLAGGEMTKWNKYLFRHDLSPTDEGVLAALTQNDAERTLDINKYGSKEKVELYSKNTKLKVQSDFDHATVMVYNPALEMSPIRDLVRHPLSEAARSTLRATVPDGSQESTIARDFALETAAWAVEQFRLGTLVGTQSHPFKHIYDSNSLEFVTHALGLGVRLYELADN